MTKCLMCGRSPEGEASQQKEYRILTCRRCANVEAGKITRSDDETSGRGGKRPAKPSKSYMDSRNGGKLVPDDAVTPVEEGAEAFEKFKALRTRTLKAKGRPGNVAASTEGSAE